ncbi:hypothetical protein GCM10011521_12880 [Arenimonas soli]|uniref:ABC transporter permease n=1 Tax=Arenimonas soli TaxID=2269504 RepID=A0ABQ1HG08_9GAMM|nr:hypothetical protein [Arenimonas soli]GGA76122.1 hypothetical protein GCM10011521_12880 [Arenimonas soli]
MFSRTTAVPTLVVYLVALGMLVLIAMVVALVTDRNPLPFPDRDYHVFSASSPEALVALEQLMKQHGHRPRFRIDSQEVDRTVFSNGTIINYPRPQIIGALGQPGGALGFVVDDPDASARETARMLKAAGLQAEVVLNAEPGLPIAFVKTDALVSGAIVFRKHVLKMGQKPPAWTPRSP